MPPNAPSGTEPEEQPADASPSTPAAAGAGADAHAAANTNLVEVVQKIRQLDINEQSTNDIEALLSTIRNKINIALQQNPDEARQLWMSHVREHIDVKKVGTTASYSVSESLIPQKSRESITELIQASTGNIRSQLQQLLAGVTIPDRVQPEPMPVQEAATPTQPAATTADAPDGTAPAQDSAAPRPASRWMRFASGANTAGKQIAKWGTSPVWGSIWLADKGMNYLDPQSDKFWWKKLKALLNK